MSMILKGIDLPKEYTQVIAITPNGEVWQVNPISKNERLQAQAIQIPKGHGDIKDVGKLEDELDERCGQLSAEIVRKAPTILDKERE